MTVTGTCGKCVFWTRKVEGNGACHRLPPVFRNDGVARFPEVRSYDWCGEFKSGNMISRYSRREEISE